MATFNNRLEEYTRLLLAQAVEHHLQVIAGGMLETHADYKYHAGKIAGLREAEALLGKALSDIQKI